MLAIMEITQENMWKTQKIGTKSGGIKTILNPYCCVI